MPPIKFSHLVTFSSEDSPAYVAQNLLVPDGTKKWRGSKEGEPKMSAVLQLQKPQQIVEIDIGNEGSAFVEVQVGRQDSDDFKTLLASSSFMSPLESRNTDHLNRVRMFGRDKLNAEAGRSFLC